MNPKSPTSREKQEPEDSGHSVFRSWCAACVEGRGVGGPSSSTIGRSGKRKDDSALSFR